MADKEQNKQSFGERMQENYRLVILRSDDFRELKSFDLSMGSIYTVISTLSVLMLILFFCLFAYTPLKKIIPGYGNMEVNSEFLKLVSGIDELESKIEAQTTYLDAFSRMLTQSNAIDGPNQNNESSPSVNLYNSSATVQPTNNSTIIKERESIEYNRNDDNTEIYMTIGKSDLIKPVEGVISSDFSSQIRHFGIDILAPKNTPVKSIMDGFVFSSGWDLETGYTIGVQHTGNILSFYKHNSILLKEKGTFVRAGEALAIIGNTGTLSSGPHLHFELWHNGRPVNPKDFINFK